MRLVSLVRRNLGRRRLATVLTTLSVGLGVALFAAIGALRQAAQDGFQRSASVCDLVVGAKGSPLQLVLNALYHMGLSPGNVPFSVYEELHETPGVLWAVPMALGDSYRGQRIVAVTDELFEVLELRDFGKLRFAGGEAFEFTHEELLELHADLEEEAAHEHDDEGHDDHDHDHGHGHGEYDKWHAVVGATAARLAQLEVGDRFVPAHDLQGGPSVTTHEEAETTVVGVLEPTGTPIDRAIFIPLGAFYSIDGHKATAETTRGGTRDPLGLSAVLVHTNPRTGHAGFMVWRNYNDRLDTQAARPAAEIQSLFEIVGNVDAVLRIVAGLVVVVALLGVLVAIYNTMGMRRREFAVLRALGARRTTILALVMAESAAIALLGGLLGLILAGVGVLAAAGELQARTGVYVTALPGLDELLLLVAVVVTGAIAGLVPALSAYRTEAASYLASTN